MLISFFLLNNKFLEIVWLRRWLYALTTGRGWARSYLLVSWLLRSLLLLLLLLLSLHCLSNLNSSIWVNFLNWAIFEFSHLSTIWVYHILKKELRLRGVKIHVNRWGILWFGLHSFRSSEWYHQGRYSLPHHLERGTWWCHLGNWSPWFHPRSASLSSCC